MLGLVFDAKLVSYSSRGDTRKASCIAVAVQMPQQLSCVPTIDPCWQQPTQLHCSYNLHKAQPAGSNAHKVKCTANAVSRPGHLRHPMFNKLQPSDAGRGPGAGYGHGLQVRLLPAEQQRPHFPWPHGQLRVAADVKTQHSSLQDHTTPHHSTACKSSGRR